MRTLVAILLAGSLALAFPGVARATNGALLPSRGARDAGRGTADGAVADDPLTIGRNPAGISFIYGHRFDQSIYLFAPNISFENDLGGDRHAENQPIPSASFGVAYHVGRPISWGRLFSPTSFTSQATIALDDGDVPPWKDEFAGSPITLGLAIYGLAGGTTDMTLLLDYSNGGTRPNPGPREWEYFSDTKIVAIGPAIAYRVSSRISLGLALNFIYGLFEQDSPIEQPKEVLRGETAVSGVTFAQAGGLSNLDDFVGFADMDGVSSFGFQPRFGVFFRPTDEVSLGAYLATQTFMQDYLGKVTAEYRPQIEAIGEALLDGMAPAQFDPALGYRAEYNLRIEDFNLPMEIGLAGAWRPAFAGGRLMLAADIRYINWSGVMNEFRARLSEGNNVNLNILTGSSSVHASVPLDWNDQVVVALGASVQATDFLVVRAGYNFGNNPIPARTLLPTIPAISEHHLALGVSFYPGLWEITGTVEYTIPNQVHIDESDADSALRDSTLRVEILTFAVGVALNF